MNIDERNSGNKGFLNFKGILNMGIGALYIVVGIAVIYFKAFGAMVLTTPIAYTIGIAMVLYGSFRIWRGWVDVKQKPGR